MEFDVQRSKLDVRDEFHSRTVSIFEMEFDVLLRSELDVGDGIRSSMRSNI